MGTIFSETYRAMSMSLLPRWVAVVWTAALLAVMVLHIWHAVKKRGQVRWWHIVHVAMAAGMMTMYMLPATMSPAGDHTGLVIFAALGVLVLMTVSAVCVRENVVNPLWLTSAAGAMIMTYMFLPSTARSPVVTWVVVGYLAAEIVAWLGNLWARLPLYTLTRANSVRVADGSPGAAETTRPVRVGLLAYTDVGVRVTLAALSAAMAYMLVAMHLGVT